MVKINLLAYFLCKFLLEESLWIKELKENRGEYGISQNKLAVTAGITRQYLSDIENGKVRPSAAKEANALSPFVTF